jgi:hypothetical protein
VDKDDNKIYGWIIRPYLVDGVWKRHPYEGVKILTSSKLALQHNPVCYTMKFFNYDKIPKMESDIGKISLSKVRDDLRKKKRTKQLSLPIPEPNKRPVVDEEKLNSPIDEPSPLDDIALMHASIDKQFNIIRDDIKEAQKDMLELEETEDMEHKYKSIHVHPYTICTRTNRPIFISQNGETIELSRNQIEKFILDLKNVCQSVV